MLLWSSRWRWFHSRSRRSGRGWSTMCSPWCVWPWCPLCWAWWDFTSTKRPVPRRLAKRRPRIRRSRRNKDKSLNYLNKCFLIELVLYVCVELRWDGFRVGPCPLVVCQDFKGCYVLSVLSGQTENCRCRTWNWQCLYLNRLFLGG